MIGPRAGPAVFALTTHRMRAIMMYEHLFRTFRTGCSMTGLAIRTNRLFARGTLLLAALDHGQYVGVPDGLSEPAKLVESLAGEGIDGFILNAGIASSLRSFDGEKLLVLRITHAGTRLSGTSRRNKYFLGPEDALRLGADAVISMVVLGHDDDVESLHELAAAIGDYHRFGIPVIAEALPADPGLLSSPKAIADISRICAELGRGRDQDRLHSGFRDRRSRLSGARHRRGGGQGGRTPISWPLSRTRSAAGRRASPWGETSTSGDDARAFAAEVGRTMGRKGRPHESGGFSPSPIAAPSSTTAAPSPRRRSRRRSAFPGRGSRASSPPPSSSASSRLP